MDTNGGSPWHERARKINANLIESAEIRATRYSPTNRSIVKSHQQTCSGDENLGRPYGITRGE